jgi:hypothetical protein
MSLRAIAVAAAVAEVVLVASVGAYGLGGSPVLSAPLAVSAPVIDGTISPANEWADAGVLRFRFGAAHDATLEVKHDDTYLYLLLSVVDDPPSGGIVCCSASVYFDNNHNGVRDIGEDELGFGPSDQFSDQFYGLVPNDPMPSPRYADDRLDGGTVDAFARGSYDAAGHTLVLEARKPLCSDDSKHDFCLTTGSTVGFTIDYFTSDGQFLDYPVNAEDFGKFADLQISPSRLADVAVRATADRKSVRVGETVTYTIVVTNNGPAAATNVSLATAYRLAGVTATVPGGAGVGLGTLAPGRARTVKQTITPTAVAQGGGTIAQTVTASSAELDPTHANDAARGTVDVTSAPAAGEAVAAATSGGTVSVRSAGTKAFVPLRAGKSIATGSEIDATRGKVRVTSATPAGRLQSATASAGRFLVTQPKASALTTLRLSAPLRCGPGTHTTVLRSLRVEANGTFRTIGARGWVTSSDRHARWLIRDLCVPVGRSLATDAAKRPKRTIHTCVTNLSRRSEADFYDLEGHRQRKPCR